MEMAQAFYVEQDCVFNFKGKAFKASGVIVTDQWLVAYPGKTGVLNDWHGQPIGTWRATASWATPRSWVGSRMFQIEATVNGRVYTGRGYGVDMLYRGKLKAGKPNRLPRDIHAIKESE